MFADVLEKVKETNSFALGDSADADTRSRVQAWIDRYNEVCTCFLLFSCSFFSLSLFPLCFILPSLFEKRASLVFLSCLRQTVKANFPFTLILQDPLGRCYIMNPFYPQPDPNLIMQYAVFFLPLFLVSLVLRFPLLLPVVFSLTAQVFSIFVSTVLPLFMFAAVFTKSENMIELKRKMQNSDCLMQYSIPKKKKVAMRRMRLLFPLPLHHHPFPLRLSLLHIPLVRTLPLSHPHHHALETS